MRVAVVGCGVMGAATARSLASRGHDVSVYERFEVGHKHGSSHGATRIYRYSYPDALYVGMMKEALVLWHELERASGATLLTTRGGLDTGKRLDEHCAALDEHDIPYEVIEPEEVTRRWPSIHIPGRALYQAEGGTVRADRAWTALTEGAISTGAVYLREKVVALDGATVETTTATTPYDVVVVTAGGWASELLSTTGIDLRVKPTRETVAFFRMDEDLPTVVDWGDPSVYALHDPVFGLKVGEHIAGPETSPEDEGVVNHDSVERLSDWVGTHFPTASPEPEHAETCIYTNTPDEHFILERHGDVVVGSACSGHGFKFAPLIGKRLADLAEG